MVRSRGLVRVLGLGCRQAALFGVILAVAVPACSGRSIRIGEDEPTNDDGFGGTIAGGAFPTGGTVATGGAVAAGGTPAGGGTFPRGGTPATGGTFPVGGTVATGGTVPAGGTPATGGTVPTGGTPATGGGTNGGTSVGGMSGVGGVGPTGGAPACGSAGAPNTFPECRGIKSNMACPFSGTMCPWLPCGLADSGRRECYCATTWTCTSCDYSDSQFRDAPAVIPACPAAAADAAPCTTINQVCGPIGSEYCACYQDCVEGLIWDCNSPPSTWEF